MEKIGYTPAERRWLIALAAFGFVVLNGIFVWGVLCVPGSLRAALTNPVSAAMIADTLIVMGILAYLLPKWGATRLGGLWFVVLSLIGGMVFALPTVLLWRHRGGSSGT